MASFKLVFGLLVAIAAGISIGATLAIIGCAIQWNGIDTPENWFALISAALYILAPFPVVIAKAFSSKMELEDPDDVTVWEHYGAFLSSFIATIGLGLLFVLAHAGIIQWETLAFEVSGGVVIVLTLFISLFVYKCVKRREEENTYY